MLVAARTPPNLSVLNPIERPMCVISMGLNGLTLGRKELSEKIENQINQLTSKKKWRNAQVPYLRGESNAINFREIINHATKDCVGLKVDQISQLYYKGEQFKIGKKATEADQRDLMSYLEMIDDSIDWYDKYLTKKEVMKSKSVQEFYRKHVSINQYCFQIKKCTDKNCNFHKPVTINKDEFSQIKWLPMPTISLNLEGEEKYNSFDKACELDEIPSDRNRPGESMNIIKK